MFSTLIIIRNISMISEGSRGTEDWINWINDEITFEIYSHKKHCNNCPHLYSISYQINTAKKRLL